MTHLTFTNNGKTYRQITKRTAKKLYFNGKTIFVAPANMRPFGFGSDLGFCTFTWNVESANDYDRNYYSDRLFDVYCNECAHYNCNNETGRYLRFYAEF